jgi:hypothetical protein
MWNAYISYETPLYEVLQCAQWASDHAQWLACEVGSSQARRWAKVWWHRAHQCFDVLLRAVLAGVKTVEEIDGSEYREVTKLHLSVELDPEEGFEGYYTLAKIRSTHHHVGKHPVLGQIAFDAGKGYEVEIPMPLLNWKAKAAFKEAPTIVRGEDGREFFRPGYEAVRWQQERVRKLCAQFPFPTMIKEEME